MCPGFGIAYNPKRIGKYKVGFLASTNMQITGIV